MMAFAGFMFGACTTCCVECTIDSSPAVVLAASDAWLAAAGAASLSDATHVAADALTTDATATLRLMAARLNDDNYLFGDLSRAAGAITLRLGQRLAGVETWLSFPVTVADTGGDLDLRHAVSLCWEPGEPATPIDSSTGPQYPFSTTGTGGGWTDPDNVLDNDGNVALYNVTDTASDTLHVHWTAMGVPAGATVTGFQLGSYLGSTGIADVNDEHVVLSIDGNSSADRATNSPMPSPPAPYDWGSGAGDDWSFSPVPTPEQVNGLVTAGLQWKCDPGTGDQLSIEVFALNAFYTTADRLPGRLRMTYANSSTSAVTCAFALNAFGRGLGAGVRSVSGDWDLDSLVYSYHQSPARPSCPACNCTPGDVPCDCCPPAGALAAYVLDFGASTLTDVSCVNVCAQIAGGFVVQFYGLGNPCQWVYLAPIGPCTFSCSGFDVVIHTISIVVSLLGSGVGNCYFTAAVSLSGEYHPDPFNCGTGAFYVSDPVSDCRALPITLSKAYEVGTAACSGAFPDTITLEAP